MKLQSVSTLAVALLLSLPAATQAALSSYSQNFESLVQADPAALSNDGWLVFGNVFSPSMAYLYGYGPFPAPNGGAAFSAIDAGQGGPEQGAQQLSVYNDYNNTDHGNGNLVEANVFHEQTVSTGDVGGTWVFAFDAKLGNLVSPSTALAFIKTLDPNNGYALTNFLILNTTSIPTTWTNFSISIPITADLDGQILQFGFASTATNYVSSGVFYDNVSWARQTTDVPGTLRPRTFELHAAAPNPFPVSTQIEYSMARGGIADVSIVDVTGRRVATLFQGMVEPGSHAVSWNGRFEDGRTAPAGVYRCVLQTAAGLQARSVVLSR